MFLFLHLYKAQTRVMTLFLPLFFQTGEMCLSCQISVSWIHLSCRTLGHMVPSHWLVPLYRCGHTPVACFAKTWSKVGVVETRRCLIFYFLFFFVLFSLPCMTDPGLSFWLCANLESIFFSLAIRKDKSFLHFVL